MKKLLILCFWMFTAPILARPPAILSEELEKTEYLLGKMEVGRKLYFPGSTMLVLKDRTCWLYTEDSGSEIKGLLMKILVERKQDGYHVVVVGKCTWKVTKLTDPSDNLVPVKTITIKINRD